MSQSGFIAAMLLAAFIIWLAVNDRLQTYTAVLFGPTAQPKPQGNISTNNGMIVPSPIGPTSTGGPGGFPSLPDSGSASDIIDTTAQDAPLLLDLLP